MATARRGRGRGKSKGHELSLAQTLICDNGNDVSLECDLCHLQFPKEDALFNHKISKHPEYYEYECGQCDDKLFGRLEELEKHFKSVHMGMEVEDEEDTVGEEDEQIKRLEMEVDKVTESLVGMEDNYGNDEEEDGQGDDHFDEGGGNSDQIEEEEEGGGESESGGKPFKCPFCPKSYPWKTELTIHLRSHTGEKPYTCEECGQAFSVYRSMVDHQKRHNKKYEYFCEVVGCGKGFVKKQDRDRHEVQGHVPLHLRAAFQKNQCEVCGKNFANSTHLKIHVNAVHGKGPGYPCHLCGKSFGHQSSLRSHLQSKKHGGTGLSFRNKKKNNQPVTNSTSTTSLEGTTNGGNLPSVSVPTRTLTQTAPQPEQKPIPVTFYPNAPLIHPQFNPNFQPQSVPLPLQSGLLVLDASQVQGQGQRISQQNSSQVFGGNYQQGTVTLQDAFQMAYGIGGGGGGNGGTGASVNAPFS